MFDSWHVPDASRCLRLTCLFMGEDRLWVPLNSSSAAFVSRDATMFCSRVLWVLTQLRGRHTGSLWWGRHVQRWSCTSCCWMEATALLRTSSCPEDEDEVKVLWMAIHIFSFRASNSLSSWSSSSEEELKSSSSWMISLLLISSSSWSSCTSRSNSSSAQDKPGACCTSSTYPGHLSVIQLNLTSHSQAKWSHDAG